MPRSTTTAADRRGPNGPPSPDVRRLHVWDAAGRALLAGPVGAGRRTPALGEVLRLPNDSRPLVNGRGLLWRVVSVASCCTTRHLLVLAEPARGGGGLVVDLDQDRSNLENLEGALRELEDRTGIRRNTPLRVRLAMRVAGAELGDLDLVVDVLAMPRRSAVHVERVQVTPPLVGMEAVLRRARWEPDAAAAAPAIAPTADPIDQVLDARRAARRRRHPYVAPSLAQPESWDNRAAHHCVTCGLGPSARIHQPGRRRK